MIRVSLREMFVLVAVVALAIVSLLFASPVWQMIIGVAVGLVAMIALIVSLVDRGPRRAIAIGFAVAMLGYLLVILNAQKLYNDAFGLGNNGRNIEFDTYSGRLPTSIALGYVFNGISQTKYYDAKTGERIPETEMANVTVIGSGIGGVGFGGGFGVGQQLVLPGQRAAYSEERPPRESFMVQGHFWWALLFGYVGGHFARHVYFRRDREAKNGVTL